MIPNSRSQHSKGWKPVLFTVGPFTVLTSYVAYRLAVEDRWYSATGWIIITCVFILFISLSFIPARNSAVPIVKLRQQDVHKRSGNLESLVPLFRSRDLLEISLLKEALLAKGIVSAILNEHSATMLQFLPDVEIVLAVPERHIDAALDILDEFRSST